MKSKDAYRKDVRSDEQFKKDIEYGNLAEKDIMVRFVKTRKEMFDEEIVFEENGCDNTGQYLQADKVTMDVDYKVNGKPFEVKFNNNFCNVFRLKKSQLNSYIRQNATILWINAYTTEQPKYMLLTTEDLESIKKHKTPFPFKKWGGKLTYQLYEKDFKWERLL